MYRTISIKIKPTQEQHQLLLATTQAFTSCYNTCLDYGWHNKTSSKRKIHQATYYPLRQRTNLPADLVIQARQKASETLKSLDQRKKRGKKISKPVSKLCSIRYNYKSSKINFTEAMVSLSTLKGRLKIPIKVSAFHKQFSSGKYCSADLVYRQGKWYLNLVLELPTPELKAATDCLGLDLGVSRLAVSSQAKFYRSKHLHSLVARHRRLRGDLQSQRSKSARKKLKRISGYWQRLQRNVNHHISRQIVDSCPPGFAIALEDLTNIRETTNPRKEQRGVFHNWSFYQLRKFIEYKAQAKGTPVLFVNPKNTSKTCSRCGHLAPGNRKSQTVFTCQACGISLNADFNASQNIRQLGISLLSSLSVNQRNVGGYRLADKLTA